MTLVAQNCGAQSSSAATKHAGANYGHAILLPPTGRLSIGRRWPTCPTFRWRLQRFPSPVASLLVLSAAALAATPERPKLPPDLDRIVQLANATPPEFTADALLRVATQSRVVKSLRIELIDHAFHAAAGAQFPTPLIADNAFADTGSAMTASAAKLKLDTLSLQVRAVLDMLQIDRPAARKLFLEINPPTPDPRSCDQPIPDVASMYDALAAVANTTFTEQERKKEEHLNLVMSYMARATSRVQLEPLQKMIASLNLTADQRDILTTRLESLRQSLALTACPPPKPVELASRPDAFWKSEQSKHLYEQGARLRYKEPGAPYSDAERNTIEWLQRLTDYMKDLADWRPSDEKDEATYYHQKTIVYEMLVDLIPRGPERDKAIQAFVDFVANSGLQREKPVEWFFHAQSLLDRARNSPIGEPAKILAAFEDSGNPALLLYIVLDKLGRSPQT
jgi:hypothetical protein